MPNILDLLIAAHGLPAMQNQQPMFAGESNDAYGYNQQYAVPGPYTTSLGPLEAAYRKWLRGVTTGDGEHLNPDDRGYDMRGYYKDIASQGKTERGSNMHFPDTYKTPYNSGFSSESKYSAANPNVWFGDDLMNLGTGQRIR